jgi:branched-chain amino acid transport system permease protein
MVLALVLMAAFGLFFELTVYYPLRNRSFLPVIIATIGASIMMQNGALAIFGPSPEKLRPVIDTAGGTGGINLSGVFFDYQYLVILLVTVMLIGGQYLFFEYTLLGKKMQATSQDKDMASLLGIPVTIMIALTFIYSSLLGGLSGMLVAPIFFVTHKMGATLGLKAFAATICGGFGDPRGAILGGLLLGVVESLGAAYISVIYKDAFSFLVLIIFLLVRPQGMFGEKVSEKA